MVGCFLVGCLVGGFGWLFFNRLFLVGSFVHVVCSDRLFRQVGLGSFFLQVVLVGGFGSFFLVGCCGRLFR